MKKALIISGIVILVTIIGFDFSYFIVTTPNDIGNFSINDYATEISNVNFQTEKNYGSITDYKSAANAGKTAIIERFENTNGSLFEWIGCDVRYDKENDAYYVRTYHLFPLVLGGAYNVIIKSDGTVLAIWGEK